MMDKQNNSDNARVGQCKNSVVVPDDVRMWLASMGFEEARPGVFSLHNNADGVERRCFVRFDREHPDGALLVQMGDDLVSLEELDEDDRPAPLVGFKQYMEYMEQRMGATKQGLKTVSTGGAAPQVATQQMVQKQSFMRDIRGTPCELAVTLGGKRYATKLGRWYVLYASGRRIKSSRVEILHTSFDPEPRNGFPVGVAAYKSIITLTDGSEYEAIGIAYCIKDSQGRVVATNVNQRMEGVACNLDHLAETRAKNRCLGDITAGGWYDGNPSAGMVDELKHVEGCSAEEILDYEEDESGDSI